MELENLENAIYKDGETNAVKDIDYKKEYTQLKEQHEDLLGLSQAIFEKKQDYKSELIAIRCEFKKMVMNFDNVKNMIDNLDFNEDD